MDCCHAHSFQYCLLHDAVVLLDREFVGPGISAVQLGLRFQHFRRGQEALLPNLPVFQAGSVSPLLGLQSLRTKHGPPLPVDQQLRRLLEQESLHAPLDLRLNNNLICASDTV